MNYTNAIKTWVHYDNLIKKYNDDIKPIREKKKSIETQILNYTEKKQLENNIIKISNDNLSFKRSVTTQPLSIKFIQKCLSDIIPNDNHVNSIINYIESKRETNERMHIKRSTIKEK